MIKIEDVKVGSVLQIRKADLEYIAGNILYSCILFIHGGSLCVKSES